MDLHVGRPYWPRKNGLLGVHPPLREDTSCDVVVVGGGITGALVALELTLRGLRVVVLDRRDAAGGSTSASTSLLQYEIDELLVDLIEAIGEERAVAAYRASGRGIELVERAVQQAGHLCGFRRSPSVYVAPKRASVATLRSELDARAAAGFDVRWLSRDELVARWGIVGLGGIESALAAAVDPYRLSHHALATVLDRGGRVHDRTEVVTYEHRARGITVHTNRDASVRATHVVLATGYEAARLLPPLPIRLLSTFAFVSEPIDDLKRRFPRGLLMWDHDDPYLYARVSDDDRVFVGGRDVAYRDPARLRRALPAKTRALVRDIERRIPGLDVEVAFDWCGPFAETIDGLPYIGPHPAFPRGQFALGFGGNGITYSALAAEYIADTIQHGVPADPAAQLFRLDRPLVAP